MPKKPLSRKEIRNNFIDVKNRIRRAAPVLGGHFYTHDFIDQQTQWIDFYFLRDSKPYYWAATISTAKYALQEQAEEKAMDELEEKLGIHWYTLPHAQRLSSFNALGGLTYLQWLSKRQKQILDEQAMTVKESVSLEPGYYYNEGLAIIVDTDQITVDIINQFIHEFRQAGEKPWQSDEMISYPMKDIDCGRGLVNPVLEPWDWPNDDI